MPIIEAMLEDSGRRVLFAEDSATYQKMVGTCMRKWGFDVISVRDGEEAWQILQDPKAPRLLLLDWMLPGIEGVDLCRRIRQAESDGLYSYIIVLTAKHKERDLLQAMDAGVDDYISKPFREFELRARLLVGKRILDLTEQLIAARESMRQAATIDALTGIMNRRAIMDSLVRELNRGRREKKPVGVILVDLDHFKQVNDTHGHLCGDEVLKQIGQKLRSNLRVYDSVGRYGGEEFLLILPGCDLENATMRARGLCSLIAQPLAVSGIFQSVTASMGVASAAATDVRVESVLDQADCALYAAKKNGRNRVEPFTADSRSMGVSTSLP